MELRKCERKDNSEHRPAKVAKENRHEGRDFPVLSLSDDDIQVAAKLVTL